jgi:plastocyanin
MTRPIRLFVAAAALVALWAPAQAQETPAMEEAQEEMPETFPPMAVPPERVEPGAVVEMRHDHRFLPEVVTIEAGDEVLWRNASILEHTVTLDPGEAGGEEIARLPEGARTFNSGPIEPGNTFRHVFEVPGRYRYFCIPHHDKGMIGEIVVEAEAGTADPATAPAEGR